MPTSSSRLEDGVVVRVVELDPPPLGSFLRIFKTIVGPRQRERDVATYVGREGREDVQCLSGDQC